jgi:hypothetical protein
VLLGRRTATASICVLLLTACGSGDGGQAVRSAVTPSASTPTSTTSGATASDETSSAPLRAGERFLDLPMPDGAYSPVAPRGGKDEYRCFLLDPDLAEDTFVTGAEVLPGRVEIVHHAIIFRVGPDQVATAEQADEGDPGTGWTCFGGTAFPGRGGGADVVSALDSAPWLSAWAPGGGENVFGPRTGVLLEAGSRLILQVHYNLRNGAAPDDSGLRVRLADGKSDLEQLQTMLLVAPVELPCAKGETSSLCDRQTAVLDLMQRFGAGSGATVAGLQLLCDGNVVEPRAGPTQHCDRRVSSPMLVRAAAGHMHLLGRSITIELNPGTPRARTLLDRAVWDFDNQRATPLVKQVRVARGDVLRVTCTHDAGLRRLVPELADEQPRYVTWGEGTSDEMCLGIVIYTKS